MYLWGVIDGIMMVISLIMVLNNDNGSFIVMNMLVTNNDNVRSDYDNNNVNHNNDNNNDGIND